MTRRWALLPLPLLIASVVATPWALSGLAAREGLRVERAGWCAPGICLTGVSGRGVEARWVQIGWDRRVQLKDVTVDLALLRSPPAAAPASPAPPGAPDADPLSALIPGGIASIDVTGLQLTGAPVPISPLSGRVWPDRHLTGDGVEITGDSVRAELPTEYGPVTVQARPDADGIAVEATCGACRYRDEELSADPLRLPPVSVRGVWDDGRFTGTVAIGEAEAAVSAVTGAAGIEARVDAQNVPFEAVYAVFGPIVPELARARLAGSVTLTGTVRWPGPALDLHPAVDGLSVHGVLPPGYDGGRFTWRARDVDGNPTTRTGGEGTPGWLPLADLGEILPAAVVAAEDARFWGHPGYDLDGMVAAAADNAARGETWRGGSTLTQQLAKNLFLDGTRTYARKLRELLYAIDLESTLGKRRVLELYLNVVEWGPGVYGAKEAADRYFLKRPAGLLPEEAAWLASILPRPRSAWTSEYLRDRPHVERVRAILDSMRTLPPDVREAAKARKLRFVPP